MHASAKFKGRAKKKMTMVLLMKTLRMKNKIMTMVPTTMRETRKKSKIVNPAQVFNDIDTHSGVNLDTLKIEPTLSERIRPQYSRNANSRWPIT